MNTLTKELLSVPPPLPTHKEPIVYVPDKRISFESDSTFMSDNDSDINEHEFWQAHSSTVIISPSQNKPIVSLAAQVKQILGSVMEETDELIEEEWDQSRERLDRILIDFPRISLPL